MILTGRPVGPEEALAMGLANRLTPEGTAVASASELARDLARFPQTCLRIDRLSCHREWDTTLDEALRFEGRGGERPLREEASRGAMLVAVKYYEHATDSDVAAAFWASPGCRQQ
jgi:enoyl-CoA hydratase